MLAQQMQQLKDLPERVGRVESQILQLRTEMKDGFSAIRSDLRAELHGVDTGLRTELHDVRDALRSELHDVRDTLRSELHDVRDALRSELHDVRDALRNEMRELSDALRNELREDIRIGVEESQNLTKGLHAEAMKAATESMQAISSVDAALRRDVIGRLDRLLERQGGDESDRA